MVPWPRKVSVQPGLYRGDPSALQVWIDPSMGAEAYLLRITSTDIQIQAGGKAGAFYARQTLKQWQLEHPSSLPCVVIEDQPDFPVRGVMLDISRCKVPTMATLLRLVDRLSHLKINQLQLYTEHTFAYHQHQTVWADASPVTAEEIRQLDAYCKERFVDLVPNQNSFGHAERWLKHPQYLPLAEAPDGAETPWGFRWKGPFSLCPTDPASIRFLSGLYDELLPQFSSDLFNVGCDETFDIGQGRSRDECERIGVHEVYLQFLQKVNALVKQHGRRMMFWGDVIIKSPELIPKLPDQCIALEWGYEADHPFDREAAAFAAAGIPFYVCPGTSSWNSIAGRTDNAMANLASAARHGLANRAAGYLITDWGDNGHLQYLSASYLPFLAGAAFSWNHAGAAGMDFKTELSRHWLDDSTQMLARVLHDLGNVYQACGKAHPNGSILFRQLVVSPMYPKPETGLSASDFDAADAAIDTAIAPTANVATHDDEARLVADELQNTAAMLGLCVDAGRARLGQTSRRSNDRMAIIQEHRRLWLIRNRPGGLEESVAKLSGQPD